MRQVRGRTILIIYVLYIFSFSLSLTGREEKKKKKIASDYGQQNGIGCCMVLYIVLLTAFWVLEGRKKRKKVAAGRWCGGMMAESWSRR